MVVPGAQQLPRHQGAAQIQMRVVFPGEADPAEDLDGVLGAAVRGVQGGSRGERGAQAPYAFRLARRAGGVPGQGAGLFDADEHVGAQVLDALEPSDGAAELFADLGVFGGGVQRTGRGAAGLGGEQDGGEVADEAGVGAQGTRGGDEDSVGADRRGGPGGVGGAVRAHGQALRGGVDGEPARAGGRGGGQQEQVGLGAGEHRRQLTVQEVAVLVLDGGERARAQRDGPDARAGGQLAHQVTGARGVQDGGGEGVRQVGARQRDAAGLFEHDGEVEEIAASAPVRLGQMDTEQPLLRESAPIRGACAGCGRGVRVEQFADLPGRYGPRQPSPYGLRERPVFFGDSDAHADPRRSQPLERRKSRTRSNLTEGQMGTDLRRAPNRAGRLDLFLPNSPEYLGRAEGFTMHALGGHRCPPQGPRSRPRPFSSAARRPHVCHERRMNSPPRSFLIHGHRRRAAGSSPCSPSRASPSR